MPTYVWWFFMGLTLWIALCAGLASLEKPFTRFVIKIHKQIFQHKQARREQKFQHSRELKWLRAQNTQLRNEKSRLESKIFMEVK